MKIFVFYFREMFLLSFENFLHKNEKLSIYRATFQYV